MAIQHVSLIALCMLTQQQLLSISSVKITPPNNVLKSTSTNKDPWKVITSEKDANTVWHYMTDYNKSSRKQDDSIYNQTANLFAKTKGTGEGKTDGAGNNDYTPNYLATSHTKKDKLVMKDDKTIIKRFSDDPSLNRNSKIPVYNTSLIFTSLLDPLQNKGKRDITTGALYRAGKTVYDAPGEIAVKLGGNKQFITGETGSLNSLVLGQKSFTSKNKSDGSQGDLLLNTIYPNPTTEITVISNNPMLINKTNNTSNTPVNSKTTTPINNQNILSFDRIYNNNNGATITPTSNPMHNNRSTSNQRPFKTATKQEMLDAITGTKRGNDGQGYTYVEFPNLNGTTTRKIYDKDNKNVQTIVTSADGKNSTTITNRGDGEKYIVNEKSGQVTSQQTVTPEVTQNALLDNQLNTYYYKRKEPSGRVTIGKDTIHRNPFKKLSTADRSLPTDHILYSTMQKLTTKQEVTSFVDGLLQSTGLLPTKEFIKAKTQLVLAWNPTISKPNFAKWWRPLQSFFTQQKVEMLYDQTTGEFATPLMDVKKPSAKTGVTFDDVNKIIEQTRGINIPKLQSQTMYKKTPKDVQENT